MVAKRLLVYNQKANVNCGFICSWCLPAINPPVPFLRASCYPSGSSKKGHHVWKSLKHVLQGGVKEMCRGLHGGPVSPLLPCRGRPNPQPAVPAPLPQPLVRAGTLPALPDGVGDTLDADAVGELPHSLPLALHAALLRARHPRGSAASPRPSGCWPGACHCHCHRHRHRHRHHHAAPGCAQGQLPLPRRVTAGRCPRQCHLRENRRAPLSLFSQRTTDGWLS